MPKISVISTVYNCEAYLRESIDSVLSQTFGDFEYIILNDGSLDSTASIIKSYRDQRILFVDNFDNRKISRRRNEGIDLATGEYIAIQDGDDISLPDRFEKQVAILDTVVDCFCVGGWAERMSMDGSASGVMSYPPKTHREVVDAVTKRCLNPIIDPTTMFRRQEFQRLGGYSMNSDIYTVPDFDLWLRAIVSGKKFGNIQEPLIRYRQNTAGMTGSKKNEMIKHHMIVWRKFMSQRRSQQTD
ncbi:MAG: glycosyltransferase [Candidatus Competibacteraceae bacterium]|nr:glycosyltransferase [Candidatus Competibacteraceae bacterium]